jgi:rhodanese-related sulfurtransferase
MTVKPLMTVALLIMSISTTNLAQEKTDKPVESQHSHASEISGSKNERGTTILMIGSGKVSIDYGRPALNKRSAASILNAIRPGGYWIMGTGKATRLDTDFSLNAGNTVINGGRYLLRAKKISDNQWTLTINEVKNKQILELVELPLKFESNNTFEDILTINLDRDNNNAKIVVKWGELSASTVFRVAEMSDKVYEHQPPKSSTKTVTTTDPDDGIRRITPSELKEMFGRGDITVVDVRNEKQWQQNHIKGAKSIPVMDVVIRANELDPNKLIVSYCSCVAERSAIYFAEQLKAMGFKNVAVLLGGYDRAVQERVQTENANQGDR